MTKEERLMEYASLDLIGDKVESDFDRFCKEHNQDILDTLYELDILNKKYEKALELLSDYNMPCDIDNFNMKDENIDYCSMNCGNDKEIFKKCWDRYITQNLSKDKE